MSTSTIATVKANRRANLAAILDKYGKTELGRMTDINPDYLFQMGKGEGRSARSVSDATAQAIEKALSLPPGSLDVATGSNAVDTPQRVKIYAYDIRAVDSIDELDPETDVLVDEVDILLSAGNGTIIPEFVETKYQMVYQLRWFQREHLKPKDCKLMRVSGSSMESLLFDGDRVLINLADTRIRDGKVYAIAIGGEAKVKRLFNLRGGSLRIVSDNPDKDTYPDEIVPPDEMHTVAVIGRVVDKSGRGGL